MASTKKQVEKASVSLEQNIKRLIHKYNKYPTNSTQLESECIHYIHHAKYILKTLVAKRTSLEYAVGAFEECSRDYVNEFAKLKNQGEKQRVILTMWFTHFLRLRDGFQLMESGERRHVHDNVNGEGTRFKSGLSGALRRDGVTRKFKSQLGYTGYGWDEFYDEDVGIRKKLLETLYELTGKRTAFENVISLWEENMDHHESERKILNEQFASTHKLFVSRMNELLASWGAKKLSLVTDDKFERMTWGLLDIKRSGNKFAIKEIGGSLPTGITLVQWREKFLLKREKPVQDEILGSKTSNKQSKKRLMIEDSSDEDDAPMKKPGAEQLISKKNMQSDSTSGIEVQTRKIDLGPKCNSSSVDDIKRQLGVSTDKLANSRHQLDDENRASSMAACNDELRELTISANILSECILAWRNLWKVLERQSCMSLKYSMQEKSEDWNNNVQRWKHMCERLSRVRSKVKKVESAELYMAQENCREASMQLGSFILDEIHYIFINELHELRRKKSDHQLSLETDLLESDYVFLQAAEELFKQSLGLIVDQPSSQHNATFSIDKQWEKVQHLLLKARAQFNIGITRFELSQSDDMSKNEQRRLLSDAQSILEGAVKTCRNMRHNTVLIQNDPRSNEFSHHDPSKTWIDLATLQNFDSIELSARAKSNCGLCLWSLDQFDEAESVIIKAAETSEIIAQDRYKCVDLLGILHLLCHSQQISLLLFDLCTQSIRITSAKNKNMGEKFLKIARRAIQSAIVTIRVISVFTQKHCLNNDNESITVLHDVENMKSLNDREKAITEFWDDRINSMSENSRSNFIRKDQAGYNINRGELNYDLQRKPILPNGRRILLSDYNSVPRRNRGANRDITIKKNSTESFHSEFVSSSEGIGRSYFSRADCESIQYMPWGDELIKAHEQNEYPACCPPLPLDIPLNIRLAIEAELGDILPQQRSGDKK